MSRTIVFDLEGVLITDVEKPVRHPQAESVIRRARSDFENVYLWTAINVQEAYLALLSFCLEEYFDRVIGNFFTHPRQGRRDVFLIPGNCKILTELPKSRYRKDLTILEGRVEDKVLIEDIHTYTEASISKMSKWSGLSIEDVRKSIKQGTGYPPHRVIKISSFKGQKDHDLNYAYNQALALFP
ncbi:MAG: hypothetical protein AABY10_00965 [Nanoarchaeota archaeon]